MPESTAKVVDYRRGFANSRHNQNTPGRKELGEEPWHQNGQSSLPDVGGGPRSRCPPMITTRLAIGGGVRQKRTPKTRKTLQEERKKS